MLNCFSVRWKKKQFIWIVLNAKLFIYAFKLKTKKQKLFLFFQMLRKIILDIVSRRWCNFQCYYNLDNSDIKYSKTCLSTIRCTCRTHDMFTDVFTCEASPQARVKCKRSSAIAIFYEYPLFFFTVLRKSTSVWNLCQQLYICKLPCH